MKAQDIIDEVSKEEDSKEEAKQINQKQPQPKKQKKKLKTPIRRTIKLKILSISNKFKGFFGKLLDSEDRKALKDFIIYCLVFGIMLNYIVFVIFKLSFTYYSWLAWGMILWFMENKLVNLIRRIIK